MVILAPYQKTLGAQTEETVVERFFASLAITNRTHDFFVDWDKVRHNVQALSAEIALLGSLAGSAQPEANLRLLLRRYPEVARAIPILVAVRDLKFKVLEDVQSVQQYSDYDFSKLTLTQDDVEAIVRFCAKTGISSMLASTQALRDYVLGVEVGTDTNARKNRSGTAMEDLISPVVDQLAREQKGLRVRKQKRFSELAQLDGIPAPRGLEDRRFDIVVLTDTRRFNIEINFYAGGGSKPQEIVDSYINRHRELTQAGWELIWATDGYGWKSGASQMRKAFRDMSYVLNIDFVRRGVLSAILTAR